MGHQEKNDTMGGKKSNSGKKLDFEVRYAFTAQQLYSFGRKKRKEIEERDFQIREHSVSTVRGLQRGKGCLHGDSQRNNCADATGDLRNIVIIQRVDRAANEQAKAAVDAQGGLRQDKTRGAAQKCVHQAVAHL
jgi:hypothetical protein